MRVFRACPIFFMSMSPAGVANPGVMSPGKTLVSPVLGSIEVEAVAAFKLREMTESGTGVNLSKEIVILHFKSVNKILTA